MAETEKPASKAKRTAAERLVEFLAGRGLV